MSAKREGRRALALFAALLVAALARSEPAPALTNEEVVRRLVEGASTEELLRLIAAREPAFDLSPEMRDELVAAGVPSRLLEAMAARQAEADRATGKTGAQVAEAEAAADTVTLALQLEGRGGDRPARLRVHDLAPSEVAAAAGLPARNAPRLHDVGLFFFCRTPEHVPDHWRNRSPLGRDFAATPRHELLAFASGATHEPPKKMRDALGQATGTGPAPGLLTLELPLRLEGRVEPGLEHDLSLGLAVEIDGRFLLLTEERWDDVLVAGPLELRAEVHAAPGAEPVLRFLREANPAPAPPDH